MKASAIVTLIGIALAIAALAYWVSLPTSALEAGTPIASSTPQIPGDNLTLGQDTNSTLGNYLIAYNGMTLYTYAQDTDGTSHCAGACEETWPPYVVTSADNLVAESPISGAISTAVRPDGRLQVAYDGRPLYFYAGDAAAGDTKGEAIGGAWQVAKP